MPVQMLPQMAIPPQMGAQVSVHQWPANSSALSSPPARSMVQSVPMRPFEPHVVRPQNMQETFRTPSPFQGGPPPLRLLLLPLHHPRYLVLTHK